MDGDIDFDDEKGAYSPHTGNTDNIHLGKVKSL